MMTNPDQITARMNELSAFIERAQEQLQQGEIVDLTHLDSEVAKLCDLTLRMKAADAMKVQPTMADMIAKLENLGQDLKNFQNQFKPTGQTQ